MGRTVSEGHPLHFIYYSAPFGGVCNEDVKSQPPPKKKNRLTREASHVATEVEGKEDAAALCLPLHTTLRKHYFSKTLLYHYQHE